jgi:hypothetical protein
VTFPLHGFRGDEPLTVNAVIEVSKLVSLILTHNIKSEIRELN